MFNWAINHISVDFIAFILTLNELVNLYKYITEWKDEQEVNWENKSMSEHMSYK